MRRLIAALLCLMSGSLFTTAQAQEVVQIAYTGMNAGTDQFEAVLRKPEGPGPHKAIVILHHAGGWRSGTTEQYGELLQKNGFVTLEPRMFAYPLASRREAHEPAQFLAQAFGALQYLAKMPEVNSQKISVMGLSYGANMTIYTASDWAARKFTDGKLKFHSGIAFYPTCFTLETMVKGKRNVMIDDNFPDDFLSRWSSMPLLILSGGKDDYEDRDPQACQSMVDAMSDEAQRKASRVIVYPKATHGWDHGRTYSFFTRMGCKMQGCQNTNESDEEVTAKAKDDLIRFLTN